MFGKTASFMQLCFRSARNRLLPFKESTGVAQPGPLAYPKPFCGDQPGAAAWTAKGAADARRSFITQDGDKGKRDPSSGPHGREALVCHRRHLKAWCAAYRQCADQHCPKLRAQDQPPAAALTQR
jgi:hypothetical protein